MAEEHCVRRELGKERCDGGHEVYVNGQLRSPSLGRGGTNPGKSKYMTWNGRGKTQPVLMQSTLEFEAELDMMLAAEKGKARGFARESHKRHSEETGSLIRAQVQNCGLYPTRTDTMWLNIHPEPRSLKSP